MSNKRPDSNSPDSTVPGASMATAAELIEKLPPGAQAEVMEALRGFVATAEEDESDAAVSMQISSSWSFSGPLPPPGLLKEYEQAAPGAVEYILKAAELEQAHRHAIDNRKLDILGDSNEKQHAHAMSGQRWGAVVMLVMLAGGIWISLVHGPNWLATILTAPSVIVAGIGLFNTVFSRRPADSKADGAEAENSRPKLP